MAEVTNWFGNLVSHPKVIVDANTVDDIIGVLKDGSRYPAPVRAVGSNHSTTPCGVAEGGTLIRMKMNRILEIGADTMRVEAGARHIDMARELEKRNLQFYVNTEIGSLTAGSAACAGAITESEASTRTAQLAISTVEQSNTRTKRLSARSRCRCAAIRERGRLPSNRTGGCRGESSA